MLLNGKIIIITGGAGLIGKQFTKAVINQGGIPIIADIDDVKLNKAVEELSQLFSRERFDSFKLNVTSKDSVKECINYVDTKYKKIDALINNAYPKNKNYGKYFFEVEYKDFVENLGENLGGCFVPSQLLSLYFKKQGYGNIVNISSIYGVIAPKFEIYDNTKMTIPVEYAAIKSGLIHLTKYMAKYLKDKNIRVNAISPGGVLDDQPEEFLKNYKKYCLNKGMLNENDLNGALIFLLSDMSNYVNGQNIIVDDGFTL